MGEQLDHIQHSSVLLDANREHKGDYKTLSLRLKNKSLPRQGSSSSIEGRRGDANIGPTMRPRRTSEIQQAQGSHNCGGLRGERMRRGAIIIVCYPSLMMPRKCFK